MAHDLKPCPFCGSGVSLDHLGSDPVRGWFVECEKCAISQHAVNTQEQARQCWNRRSAEHLPDDVQWALNSGDGTYKP